MSDHVITLKKFEFLQGKNYFSIPPNNYFCFSEQGWNRSNSKDYAVLNEKLFEIFSFGTNNKNYDSLILWFSAYQLFSVPVEVLDTVISTDRFVAPRKSYDRGIYANDSSDLIYLNTVDNLWYRIDPSGMKLPEEVDFNSIEKPLHRSSVYKGTDWILYDGNGKPATRVY